VCELATLNLWLPARVEFCRVWESGQSNRRAFQPEKLFNSEPKRTELSKVGGQRGRHWKRAAQTETVWFRRLGVKRRLRGTLLVSQQWTFCQCLTHSFGMNSATNVIRTLGNRSSCSLMLGKSYVSWPKGRQSETTDHLVRNKIWSYLRMLSFLLTSDSNWTFFVPSPTNCKRKIMALQ